MRINVIDVKYLSDVHLRAEYREILMAPHYYIRSSAKGINYNKVSDVYTLNTGHAYMWYNKMGYIKERHDLLESEMINRGFKTREHNALEPLMSSILPKDMGTYTPTKSDILINLERVLLRIKSKYDTGKPGFYKYYGKEMTYSEWEGHYASVYGRC